MERVVDWPVEVEKIVEVWNHIYLSAYLYL